MENTREMDKKEQVLLGNPTELASVVRDQTLIVSSELSVAGEKGDSTHPMKVYSKFSRFVWTIINQDRKSVSANLKVTEVPGILAASEYAYRTHMEAMFKPKTVKREADGNAELDSMLKSPAFTVHLGGAIGGASPAAYLIHASDRSDAVEAVRVLETVRDSLDESTSKTQAQRDAIAQALKFLRTGAFTQALVQKFKSVDPNALAFTKRLSSGKLKGKTPAEVILGAEDVEASIGLLRNQYKWLRENAEKNRKYAASNQDQMQAIEQAIYLYRDGKLTGEVADMVTSSAAGTVIPLYVGGFRPLTRREKKNGKTFVYELYINWNVGSDYPVMIEIRNYYATVNIKENGTMNVLASSKENEQKNTMNLTVAEWQNIIYMIQANMRMFEQKNANACFSSAARLRIKSREAAGIAG